MRIFKKNLAKKMEKYILQNLMSSALFGYSETNAKLPSVSSKRTLVSGIYAKTRLYFIASSPALTLSYHKRCKLSIL